MPDSPAITARVGFRAVGLCLVAGYVDALGYIGLGAVFAANMTGNSVLFAIAAAQGEWQRAARYGFTLAVFFAGAVIASVLRRRSGRPILPLLTGALLLLVAAFAPFEPMLELGLLALAMGFQGAAINRFGPANLQTIVVTSTMIRVADAIAVRMLPGGATPGASAAMRLDAFVWIAYVAGAAAAVGARHLMARPLLPAVLLLLVIVAEVSGERREEP
jgi:uncharacterized membrane protein YoaK (UPF0700 family)